VYTLRLSCAWECDLALDAGFVGYRDHCDARRFEDIPLTDDVAAVERALGPVAASGGGDAPEDVRAHAVPLVLTSQGCSF
jgi:hypothetical protein